MDSVKIPYVIDNQSARMADVLNGILASHKDCSLDVATAYFTVGGFGLLRDGLATGVYELQERFGERSGSGPSAPGPRITREDLQLVCFDFLSGG